jgi:hypothetical protein
VEGSTHIARHTSGPPCSGTSAGTLMHTSGPASLAPRLSACRTCAHPSSLKRARPLSYVHTHAPRHAGSRARSLACMDAHAPIHTATERVESMSPTARKVTFALLRRAATCDNLEECVRTEWRLAHRSWPVRAPASFLSVCLSVKLQAPVLTNACWSRPSPPPPVGAALLHSRRRSLEAQWPLHSGSTCAWSSDACASVLVPPLSWS